MKKRRPLKAVTNVADRRLDLPLVAALRLTKKNVLRRFYVGLSLGLYAPGMVYRRRGYTVARYGSSVGKAWSDVGSLLADAMAIEGQQIGKKTVADEGQNTSDKVSVPGAVR